MQRRKWLLTIAVGILTCLFWSLLSNLGTGGTLNRLESVLQDKVMQQSDVERAPNVNIKLIKIDQNSLDQLGQFPWDRGLYAQLISMLADAGAKAIALDIVLAEPGKDPASDALMAETMKKYPNVVLPVVFNLKAKQDGAGLLETESVAYPAETIGASPNQLAHINVIQDQDGTVRKVTVGLKDEKGTVVPALSVKLANYLLDKDHQINWDPDKSAWYRGDKRIPVDNRNQLATEFYTEPREEMSVYTGYDSQSFFDVLSGNIPAEYYQGDVVLIGPFAPGLQDEYLTPLSARLKMYGVEIHANMVQSLVAGKFFTKATKPVNYTFIIVLTLLSLLVFERITGGKAFIFYAAFVIIFFFVWILLYYILSLFITFTYPFLAMTTAFIWSVVKHYVSERKERNRVTNIFGRFVPRTVVDEMLASGEEITVGGQRRDISVIFVDIRGFTPMSEKLEPEQVIQVLNEYLDICTKAVFKWNGTLDKFIGDGVMAIFGAPINQPNHPELAVRAALEMKRQSAELEERCLREIGVPVRFGVGINSGPAVVGNIGSQLLRLDYTAIGDTVNLSARLESNAKPGQILISQETLARVEGLFETVSIGEVKVKGKEHPVLVTEVLGEVTTVGEQKSKPLPIEGGTGE
ncbi:adenylate/guanylate cyclase domain-containing protein [Paenibacillus baekrokdamisoli]|uniref:Adenylate/guanylate cyclase domain-containing protein n=1 Tax=Paenibacillus baekrokdamisoli TaxID=1712516 RepID=A0A3G9J0B5_9BACL|nr:adenylate/guanylate cyclase domain-containing protein [Paenibacillus baekrokdamisoli]MBB3067484.1 adenylate cyclase [Paenibacillus baekrokdamisoli]BBH19331.1 adenylate/guanylate cyclase domain-containing protein [Paenibacillus baekrokdamisoli]